MEYVRLEKLVELKQGLAINSHTNYLVSDHETKLALLRIADMPSKRKVVFMDEDTPDRYIADEDDIIYTRTGQVGLVFTGQNGVVHNNCFRVIPIDEQTLSRKYLFWALSLPEVYYMANIYAAGAAQPDLPHSSFKKIKIPICSLNNQKRIVSILSAYDNLIENNNKRIRLLEQMAENLYKEWFVRFRFPGHEKAEFENGLPKGWKREKIGKVYNTCSGGTPSRVNEDFYNNGSIPWVKTGELQDCLIHDAEEFITEDALKRSSAKLLPNHSLLMAMYGVNIGKLGILRKEMTCNQAVCAFLPKTADQTFYYLYFYLKGIRNYLLSISFGAAQQNLSQALIKNVRIMIPHNDTLQKFENKVSCYFDQISIYQRQNEQLSRQRDLLLPRLMSGKLEVNI